jgi:hypothetical protein
VLGLTGPEAPAVYILSKFVGERVTDPAELDKQLIYFRYIQEPIS